MARHEEKETDVAVASKMFEVLFNDECDTVVLMTGDNGNSPNLQNTSGVITL